MKLKKVMLMTALAAAIGSVNMVTALADENETETKYGWEGSGNTWRYYDSNGKKVMDAEMMCGIISIRPQTL